MLAVDWAGLSGFVAAVAALVGAVAAVLNVVRQWPVRTTVDRVHEEVKTINSLTLAQMAEAAESRRIDAIPEADRSVTENDHLHAVPILGPDDPAPPIPKTIATGDDQPPATPLEDP